MKKSLTVIFFILTVITLQIYGQLWSPIIRLTWNAGWSNSPFIAVDTSSGIHLVWSDNSQGGANEIFYKHSTNGGTTWSGPTVIGSGGVCSNPSMAVDSGSGIHVVFFMEGMAIHYSDIYYNHSTNGGASWLGLKKLEWNAGTSANPSIAADSASGIHIVWNDDTPGNPEIYYKRSYDGGTTWSGITRLSWNAGWSRFPSIAASGGTIHVVWDDYTPGNYEIYYKCSTNSGSTWSGLKRLTWNAGGSYHPSIAVSGSVIHMVWYDDTPGNYEIFYKLSTNDGISWYGPIRLTWTAIPSMEPSIAASGSVVHVVWQEGTPEEDTEIYYKCSSNGGITWSAATRLTWSAGYSEHPSIAREPGNWVHVVWQDEAQENWEIFYKNNKAGSIITTNKK